MLILSRVCAEFTDRNGAVIHRITPAMTGLFHDAPEAIRGSLLFQMLVEDGSIKMPEDARRDRNLEQDPMKGATADGRDAAIAGGDHQGGDEVSRNERAVRGTVATIEAADKELVPEKEQKPEAVSKPAKGTKTVREETKPAEEKAPKA